MMSSNQTVSKRVKQRQARIRQELDIQNISVRQLAQTLSNKWETNRKIISSGDMGLDYAQQVCDELSRDLIWLSTGHNGGQRLSKVFSMLVDLCDKDPEYADTVMDLVEKMWDRECQD
ncbi:hypothetical protein H0A36_11955 [Endozoicomonas sp. SM1973]|uniref:Uncharacterized protein n=1 Tax=Spartinivicinus marinus TaxID=2994442 RepID=A0A853IBY8_9GAMM|nr:hypothetical protein [Spartinivicinus marinus]MCX4026931.1 hypothetical protein [Spartinivicinus marinus]NYZ66725.1 hypothetical protein [Spartinivicinus marinus]